jgi:hypothetical protein
VQPPLDKLYKRRATPPSNISIFVYIPAVLFSISLGTGSTDLVQTKRLLKLEAHKRGQQAQLCACGLVLSDHSGITLPRLELLPVFLQVKTTRWSNSVVSFAFLYISEMKAGRSKGTPSACVRGPLSFDHFRVTGFTGRKAVQDLLAYLA